MFDVIHQTLKDHKHLLSGSISDHDRKAILDSLGQVASEYRANIYSNGFSNDKVRINSADLLDFINVSNAFLEHTIAANKREDNLYHAYNLMTVESDSEVSISYLPVMLEGQVAVLSSGYLSGEESLKVLNAMKKSALFRPDQYSYMLYPNKDLPKFVEKNIIPSELVEKSELLKVLSEVGNVQVIERDALGKYHFNGNFNNAESLKGALDDLETSQYAELAKQDRELILEIFEDVFNHKAFTGRSGTFFGYEGLGSIYWHMVSKLLLSVQETSVKAVEEHDNDVVIGGLLDHYYEINEGIGVHKSPELYGAFPTDPYSHTPFSKGAQQPGLTGQVKEDLLSRLGELGVSVKNGKVHFRPSLLLTEEFLNEDKTFSYPDVNGVMNQINVDKGSLCFTYCQVPVVYKLSGSESVKVYSDEVNFTEFDSLGISQDLSSKLFNRSGEILKIEVLIQKK